MMVPFALPAARIARAADAAKTIAFLTHLFGIAVLVLVAPIMSADPISRERSQRTWLLLLLTGRQRADICLSKWCCAFAHSELLILSMLPVVGIAAILGGVSSAQIVALLAALTSINLVICSAGILASSMSMKPIDAIVATYVFAGVWLGIEMCTLRYAPSQSNWPMWGPYRAIECTFSQTLDLALLFAGCAIHATLAALMAALAVFVLSTDPFGGTLIGSQGADDARRDPKRVAVHLPVAARLYLSCARPPGDRSFGRATQIVLVGAFTVVCAFLPPLGILFAVPIVFTIASGLYSARTTGGLETLLLTPTSNSALAFIVLVGEMFRARAYLLPLAVAYAAPNLLFSAAINPEKPLDSFDIQLLLVVIALAPLTCSTLHLCACCALGHFAATTIGGPARQTLQAVALYSAVFFGGVAMFPGVFARSNLMQFGRIDTDKYLVIQLLLFMVCVGLHGGMILLYMLSSKSIVSVFRDVKRA
jgi:hypothetical protein